MSARINARVNVPLLLIVVLGLSASCEPESQGADHVDQQSIVVAGTLHAPASLPSASQLFARFAGAPVVVLGTVSGVRSYFGRNEHGDKLILTQVVVTVESALRGGFRDQLIFELEGGTVGDVSLHVSDQPRLIVGDRAVFAVRRANHRQSWLVWGRSRGVLKVSTAVSGEYLRTALAGRP